MRRSCEVFATEGRNLSILFSVFPIIRYFIPAITNHSHFLLLDFPCYERKLRKITLKWKLQQKWQTSFRAEYPVLICSISVTLTFILVESRMRMTYGLLDTSLPPYLTITLCSPVWRGTNRMWWYPSSSFVTVDGTLDSSGPITAASSWPSPAELGTCTGISTSWRTVKRFGARSNWCVSRVTWRGSAT